MGHRSREEGLLAGGGGWRLIGARERGMGGGGGGVAKDLSLRASIVQARQEEGLGTLIVGGRHCCGPAKQACSRQNLLHISLRHRHLQHSPLHYPSAMLKQNRRKKSVPLDECGVRPRPP